MRVGRIAEIWRFPVKSMGGERLDAVHCGQDGLVGDRAWAVRDEAAGEIRGAKKLPRLMLCAARYFDEPAPERTAHVEMRLGAQERTRSGDPDINERLSRFLGRTVTLWPRRPAEDREHYRRRLPDDPAAFEAELREVFGRTADEALPDLASFPPELLEYTSPRGTYFDAFPIHLLTTATLANLGRLNPSARFDVRRFRPNFLIATDDGAAGSPEALWCGRRMEIGEAVVRCEMPTVRCSMTTHAQDGLPKDPSVLRTIVREADQNAGVYMTVERAGRVAIGDAVVLS
jgi:uncharacterized protein YcbX